MKSLVILAMVLALGQALRVSEWANSLGSWAQHHFPLFGRYANYSTSTRFDKSIGSSRFDIVARTRNGGKGGHTGIDSGSSSSDSGSGSSSGSGSCSTLSSSTPNCLSSKKVCGDACIPSSTTCCTYSSSLYSYYCSSTERCVSTSSTSLYKCYPSTSLSCTSTSLNANYATARTLRRGAKACASDAARAEAKNFAIFFMSTIFVGGFVLGQI